MMNRIKKVCEDSKDIEIILENSENRLRLCLQNNGEHFIQRPEEMKLNFILPEEFTDLATGWHTKKV